MSAYEFYTFPDTKLGTQLPDDDPMLRAIASYLQQGLNAELVKIYPNHVAVRGVVCYDAVNPDLSQFPLLKVYRINDTYDDFTSTTDAVIAYCLTFPDVDKLPGIMRWISTNINRLLKLFTLGNPGCTPKLSDDKPLKTEYRIMVNDV